MEHALGTRARAEVEQGTFTPAVELLRRNAALVLSLLLLAVLATYKLDMYPRTWSDEGWNLVAARALAQSGRFELETADGLLPIDETTGPTVIVPIALAFKILGVSLAHARLVVVMYLMVAAAGLFWVARQTFGRAVGVLAVLTFVALSPMGPLALGREVLGEVPALAFVFWGVATLGASGSLEHDRRWLAAGLLFGLAVLTKNQMAILLPSVAVAGLVAHSGERRFSPRRWLLLAVATLIPLALWYGYRVATMGLPWFVQHMDVVGGDASALANVSNLRRAPAALAELVSSGFTVWGAAGLVYAWLLAVKDDWRSSPHRLLLPAFATLSLAWYLVLSIGWLRYAMPAITICSLFSAKLLYDLARRYTPVGNLRTLNLRAVRSIRDNPMGTALLFVLMSSVLSGLAANGLDLLRARDTSPQDFAALVKRAVEPGTVVESSEWEIDFLAGGTYHHPPRQAFSEGVATVFLGRPSPVIARYEIPASVRYLIEGPYSRVTGMYVVARQLDSQRYIVVGTVGEYVLLRRGS